jgi:hypothetical protein
VYEGTTRGDALAWSNGEGTYIPTPIFYDGILYTCANQGVLRRTMARPARRIYRARIGERRIVRRARRSPQMGGSISPRRRRSLTSVRAVVRTRSWRKNEMKEVIMSTPAIANGLIVIRTLGHVYGVGQ